MSRTAPEPAAAKPHDEVLRLLIHPYPPREARLLAHTGLLLASGSLEHEDLSSRWQNLVIESFAWSEQLGDEQRESIERGLGEAADRPNRVWRMLQGRGLAAGIKVLTRWASNAMTMLRTEATKPFCSPDISQDELSQIDTALRHSTAPLLLLQAFPRTRTMPKWAFDLLFFLSRHRMPRDLSTFWEATGRTPDREGLPPGAESNGRWRMPGDLGVVWLLCLVNRIEPMEPEPLFVSSVLLAMAKALASELLKKENVHLLDSPLYRKVLWQSLDAVVWQETIRGLYARDVPDMAFLPVGVPSSPDKYLWLVAEYGYVVLGVQRDLRIYEHFRRAEQHEALLYHSLTDYRDHLFHAIETFLVGLGLLTAHNGPLRALFNPPGKGSPARRVDRRMLRDWFLAALCHDFGYVMEMIPSVLKVARQFATDSPGQIVQELERDWERQISALHSGIEERITLKSKLKDKRSDHGVFSYLHLRSDLRRLDQVAQDEGAATGPPARCKSEHCRRHSRALMAILKHSLMREPIDVRNEKLAGLLVLCDEIQEWQRPRYNAWELAESSVSHMSFRHALDVGPRHVCEAVTVTQCKVERGELRFDVPRGSIPRVILRYANQNVNIFDPLSRLLHKAYNLERLEGVNVVRLALEIWIPRLPRKRPGSADPDRWAVSELGILRDFCLLRETGISQELFVVSGNRPRPRERCSSYEATHQGRLYDAVCLNLNRFPAKPRRDPLLRKPPWAFEENLFSFKREYCRRNHVECALFSEDDDWPEKQIVDVSQT